MQPNVPAPEFVLNLMIAIIVFAIVALIGANYPKVGKPLMILIIVALGVHAVGAFNA